mmetsp:Transcript_30537/g.47839  ORF Transcript_30537/g.47839 Transcript_30537/m.47839 type:complete len:131 (+) Transcript_30537:1635-2027(+)
MRYMPRASLLLDRQDRDGSTNVVSEQEQELPPRGEYLHPLSRARAPSAVQTAQSQPTSGLRRITVPESWLRTMPEIAEAKELLQSCSSRSSPWSCNLAPTPCVSTGSGPNPPSSPQQRLNSSVTQISKHE